MDGQLRGRTQAPGEFTAEAVAALRALGSADLEPLLLAYHPIARLNPYHSLLYQRTWQSGIAPVPLIRAETLPELIELATLGFSTVLHLHWLNLILGEARSAREADRDRKAFVATLDRYRDAGGRLIWTIHNILPHGARFEDEEARLSADLVERCDVVHTMARRTPEIVAPWFRIPPEKTLLVPHPSYLGAYEDRISREQARHELGLWPGEIVHVVLGAIRAYKGLSQLLDAWDVVSADDRPRRLVIAGGPTEEAGVTELLERAAVHPAVLLFPSAVEPANVQLFLRAADVAVLPYLRSLNSGALLLALTFGLPSVVPAGGGLAEVVDPAFSRTFELADPESLVAVLREMDTVATPAASLAARAAAEWLAPGPLSDRFSRGLREGLAAGGSAGESDPLGEELAVAQTGNVGGAAKDGAPTSDEASVDTAGALPASGDRRAGDRRRPPTAPDPAAH